MISTFLVSLSACTMGASTSAVDSVSIADADSEIKVFRQMQAEYTRLMEKGLSDGELMKELRESYRVILLRTDPLNQRQGHQPLEWKCPKVKYGRTGLDMPRVTCGGMRQQLEWTQQSVTTRDDIPKACVDNFQAIVDRALELGVNHFETAKGYGTSEIQFGQALKKHNRSSFILQTKINPMEDARQFQQTLELSFQKLQVEYLDLFAFHGLNLPKHLEWITRPGGCLEVINKFRAAGKIRWIGFSTHGDASTIEKAIKTNLFDFVNLHYQFVGSYHCSGTYAGEGGDHGNLANVRLAHSLNMGVFCISPNDKGGMLYKPTKVMADICKEMSNITPIEMNNLWLWSHNPMVHTLSVGAARPSDLDEAVSAAKMLDRAGELVPPVEKALRDLMVERLGKTWVETWWKGLPGAYNPTGVFVAHIVWLWNLVKAWGMFSFARARYATLEGNLRGRKPELSEEENILSFNSFVPGYPYRPEMAAQIADCIPETCPNKAK
ncbi:unnamed protein product, partial [Discosporangium mesarthrocarpum]